MNDTLGSVRLPSQTVGELLRTHYAVVFPETPLTAVNPTVGSYMRHFFAVVFKRHGFIQARPAWDRRQPRRRT